jgi:hypothetical protein
MQKVTEILEQYVQWIAIGLGALFCLFMLYAYVLQPPAKATLGSETLTAGEVDPYTVDHVAGQLQAAVNNPGTIKVEVPQYVDAFRKAMSWEQGPTVEIASTAFDSKTQDVRVPTPPQQPGQPAVPQPQQPGQPPVVAGKVNALPDLPPAVPDQTKFGRSVVLLPQQPGQAVQAPQQPVMPGQPVPGGVDKDWVTALFTLNLDGVAQSLKQAQVPQALQKVIFLQVELEREECDANGNPIPNTLQVSPPLPTWRAQAPPPFPREGPQAREAQAAYLQWASSNTPDILQPAFYTTVQGRGDQWTKPGQQVQAQNVGFDPSTYTGPMTVPPLTEEQRKAVVQYRREQYKARQEQKRQAAPRTPRGGPGYGAPPEDMMEGPAFAPARKSYAAPAPRPQPAPRPYTAPPGAYRGGPPEMMPPDLMGMEGEMPGMYGGGAAVGQGLPQPGVDYPTGEYDINDPKWQGKTIEMWAHDDTVKAGKTYHYRVRYKIKNPIFLQRNIVNDPKLATQFAIVSAPSAWSSPVQIPTLVNFFVANSKAPGGNTVRFQIFRWDQGEQKTATFTVGPGDQVGGQNNGIDFSTDWTVVDFRDDPRQNDTQILLVNNKTGAIAVRSYRADADDALYQSLKKQTTPPPQPPGTATAGGTGGYAAGPRYGTP